jgi:hypothetical protein
MAAAAVSLGFNFFARGLYPATGANNHAWTTLTTAATYKFMSPRRPSRSPRPLDGDVDMENGSNEKKDAKVVIVTNLTRNVIESHLKTIFSFYGEITKIDLPLFGKCALSVVLSEKHLMLIYSNSWSEQREGRSGIRRFLISAESHFAYGWWSD